MNEGNEPVAGIVPAVPIVVRREEEQEKINWYVEDEDEFVKEKRWFTINDLMNEKNDKQFWLWDGYLPYADIAGLTGPADVGKSTLLRQLAIEVARGGNEFLGAKLYPRSGRVVYISTEDGRLATGIAMKRLMKHYNLTEQQRDNILFIFEVDDMIGEINKKLIDPHIDLIMVDCWGDIFDGNPNDFVSVRKHMKELKALAEKYDCCVLLLHHNVKNSEKGIPDKNKMNGSQAIGGKMRSLLELRLAEAVNERLLTILKANYVPMDRKNESLVLKFHKDTLLFTQENKRIPLSPVGIDKAGKFDKQLWLQRLKDNKGEEGIAKVILRFREMYPDEPIPSKSWFVENREDDNPEAVEHREDAHFEGNRPIQANALVAELG